MEKFYFEEIYNLSDTQDTSVGLVFLQSPKNIKFIGSMYAPIIINPENVTAIIPPIMWDLFLDQLQADRHLRYIRYKLLIAKDPTIGSINIPM